MKTVFVVIKIDLAGGSQVDSVCQTPAQALERVSELKCNPMLAHAVTYEVPFKKASDS